MTISERPPAQSISPRPPDLEQARYGLAIGSLGLVFDPLLKYEVVKHLAVCRVPMTVDGFEGVCNHRGQLIPVFDLQRFLFDRKTQGSVFVILDEGSRALALRLAQYPRLLGKLETTARALFLQQQRLPEPLDPCILHFYQAEDRFWLELDVEAFFSRLKVFFKN